MRVRSTLLLLAALAGIASAQTKEIAITGVRIETGDGKVIQSGVVIIRDGKIAQVGEGLPAPTGATVVDGTGKVLYPGFIDAYSTRGLKIPDAPAAGTAPDSRTTAPATMWHENRKGHRIDVVAGKCLDIKDQLNSNYGQGITTALLAPGTGTLRGVASIVDYTEAGNVLVPTAAAEIAVRGGGFGGGGGGGYPGSLLGIIALARQILIDAQAYATSTGQMPALFSADNEREIVRSLQLSNEFKLRPIIGGGRDAYRQIDAIKAQNGAVVASLDFGTEPSVKPQEGPDGTPVPVLEERHDTWVERSTNVKKLIEAGVPVAFSSFGGTLTEYLKNVRRVIGTGVARDTALKCMTSGAATILGIADRTGTIADGKQANLVLMSGDFADEKSEVICVFVEGNKIDVKKGTDK